jgi:putative flippase GtrA
VLIDRQRVARRPGLIQLVKYSLVGASNTLITFLIYIALIAAGIDYLLASAIGYAVGSANSYLLNYRWTFDARGVSHRQTLSRFAVVQGFGISANLGLIYALVHDLGFGKAPAQAVVTLLVLTITFLMNRIWAFAKRAESDPVGSGQQVASLPVS